MDTQFRTRLHPILVVGPLNRQKHGEYDADLASLLGQELPLPPDIKPMSLGALLEHFVDQTVFFIGLNVFEPVQDLPHNLQVLRALATVRQR